MSSQQKPQHFPDASLKSSEVDKLEAYDSCRTDSGFMSEEIIDSGPIEEEQPPKRAPADNRDDQNDQQKGSGTDVHMLVDSGVCLSENFSKISITQGQNDLDSPKKSELQPPVAKAKDEIPWKIYYAQNEDGDTHLHLAVASGLEQVVWALIRAAPHPRFLDIQNMDDQSPLHLAVESRQHRIARWLIVAGARPCPRDLHGDSPLHIAARLNDHLSVQAIADPVKQQERELLALNYHGHPYQPADFDQWNYLGQTCVHVAANHGNVEVMRHLVWYGANVNAREGCSGYSALHLAVERCNEGLLQFLLQCQGIKPEIETYGGKTALEVNPMVSPKLMDFLRSKGVPTPYPSDDDDDDDSEDEIMYENAKLFSMPLVNASA